MPLVVRTTQRDRFLIYNHAQRYRDDPRQQLLKLMDNSRLEARCIQPASVLRQLSPGWDIVRRMLGQLIRSNRKEIRREMLPDRRRD